MQIEKPHPESVEYRGSRTLYSKTFRMPSGTLRCESRLGRVHYVADKGELRSIDTTVRQSEGMIFCEWTPFKFVLHETGLGFDFESRQSGFASVRLNRVGDMEVDQSSRFDHEISGNVITFFDVTPGVDIVFKVLPERVKTLRIIKDAKAARTFEWFCEYDASGKAAVRDELTGFDSEGRALELMLDVVAINETSHKSIETWTGNVKTRDLSTRIKSLSDVVSYPVEIDPNVTVSVIDGHDDGGETRDQGTDAFVSANPTGGAVGRSTYYKFNKVWRFRSLTVPQGATVTNATLTLNATAGGGAGTIWGNDVDSMVTTWFAISNNATDAVKTSASTSLPRGASGITNYDVTAIVQEIVNRAGWTSGGSIGLFALNTEVSGTNLSQFEEYDAAAGNPPTLSIDYSGSIPCIFVPMTKQFGSLGDLLSMLKNTAGQKIGSQMVTAADGSAFTGSVTVSVTGDAGTQATGSVGSGACTHEGNGYHTYAPAQAETNYDLVAFTFTGTGAVPATVQVATQTAGGGSGDLVSILGTAITEGASGRLAAAFTAFLNVASPVFTAASVNQTGDSYARIGANGASLTDLATAANLATVDTVVDAIKVKTDQLAFTVANQVDANTLTGGGTGLSSDVAAIKAKTDNLPSDPADASVVAGLITAVETKVDTIDAIVDAILVDTAEIGTAGAGLTVLATAANLATVDTVVDAIKAKTDQLTFTVANQVDANALTATGASVCRYGGAFTSSAGTAARFSAWLEQNGQAVVLASGDCTIDIRENDAGSDLFSVSSSSPTAQGIFEFEELTPGFTSDRLYIATVTIDDGVNDPWVTRYDLPVFG